MTTENKYHFSTLSEQLLNTVHKDLNILAHDVLKISPIDFSITEGYRSEKRQEYLYKTGKSKTLNSKHSECKAIDICPYINNKLDYEATNDLFIIIGLFIAKAKELKVNIRVGALWDNDSVKNNGFVDGWHIELMD